MGIEAKGAKYPYLVYYGAIAVEQRPGRIINHMRRGHSFIVADSDAEALGWAVRLCEKFFPDENLWRDRWHSVVNLGGIDWVAQYRMEGVTPIPCPFYQCAG